MKKLCLILAVISLLTACSQAGKTTEAEKSADTAAKPAVGDTAVFKFSRQGYVEGKVQSIDGTRYKVLYGQSTQTVDAVDVYPLPRAGAKVDVKPGDIVVVSGWNTDSIEARHLQEIYYQHLGREFTKALHGDETNGYIDVVQKNAKDFAETASRSDFSSTAIACTSQGWRLPPDGARAARSRISRTRLTGSGSGGTEGSPSWAGPTAGLWCSPRSRSTRTSGRPG